MFILGSHYKSENVIVMINKYIYTEFSISYSLYERAKVLLWDHLTKNRDSENQPSDQFDTSAKDSSNSISKKYSCSNEL